MRVHSAVFSAEIRVHFVLCEVSCISRVCAFHQQAGDQLPEDTPALLKVIEKHSLTLSGNTACPEYGAVA